MRAALAEDEVFSVKESLRRELALSEAKVNLIRKENGNNVVLKEVEMLVLKN